MASDYEKLYRPAWKVIWGNKWLWVFSALYWCDDAIGFIPSGLHIIGKVLLAGGLIAVSAVAFVCLVSGYNQIYTIGSVSLTRLWADTQRSFGRLFIYGLIWQLLRLLPSNSGSLPNWLECVLWPASCFLSIASIVLFLTIYLANYAVVIDDFGPWGAVRTAWKIVRSFYGAFIPIGLLIMFISGAVLVAPSLFAGLGSWLQFDLDDQPMLAIMVGFLLLAFLIVFYSYLVALLTILYRHLSSQISQNESIAPVAP